MVVKRQCSFCASEIEPGTGWTFVKRDGTVFHFCSSSCRKQQLHLGRVGHRFKWTRAHALRVASEHSMSEKRAAAPAAPAKSRRAAGPARTPRAPAAPPAEPSETAKTGGSSEPPASPKEPDTAPSEPASAPAAASSPAEAPAKPRPRARKKPAGSAASKK